MKMEIRFCKTERLRSLEWGFSINKSNQLMGRRQVREAIRKAPLGTLFECCGKSLTVFEASMSARSKTATRVHVNATDLNRVVNLGAEKQYFKGFFIDFEKYGQAINSILTENPEAVSEMSRMWGVKEWQLPISYKRFRRGKLPLFSEIVRMIMLHKKMIDKPNKNSV